MDKIAIQYEKLAEGETKGKITLIHFVPQMIDQRELANWIELDASALPEPDAEMLKTHTSLNYYNPTTNEITIEYTPIPKTEIQVLQEELDFANKANLELRDENEALKSRVSDVETTIADILFS